jgi:16S rRNA (guanine527-N7)-methyltransferase
MTQNWPEAISRFLAELSLWARRMNLVGSTEPEALRRHVEDSLAAADVLPRAARVVDLGSGAGFPGIPLAIARPDLDLTLVEIRERRSHFLRHVVRSLDLRCRIERRRIQEPMAEPFDYALLRAVAPPPAAAELAAAWVSESGETWIWSGPDGDFDARRLKGSIPLASGGRILRIGSGNS